jgi:hypothetical protein
MRDVESIPEYAMKLLFSTRELFRLITRRLYTPSDRDLEQTHVRALRVQLTPGHSHFPRWPRS